MIITVMIMMIMIMVKIITVMMIMMMIVVIIMIMIMMMIILLAIHTPSKLFRRLFERSSVCHVTKIHLRHVPEANVCASCHN